MFNWLRSSKIAMPILTVLRVYLGVQWFTSGFHKIFGDTPFDAGGFIGNIVKNPVVGPEGNQLYPAYTWVMETFAVGNSQFFSFLVMWGELLIGLGLIVGLFTSTAAFFGIVMNFLFLFGGTVSVNPLYLILGLLVLVGGRNSGTIGLDFYFRKYVSPKLFKQRQHR